MEEQKQVHPHITPTVGRVVWYWPNLNDAHRVIGATDQPMRADICFVHSDGTVTLSVNDHAGCAFTSAGVQLHQGDAAGCSLPRPFATWMPYQREQHLKQWIESDDSRRQREQQDLMTAADSVSENYELQRRMLVEQVRQLRLMNDAQELCNEQQRSSMRDPGGPGKPVDPLPEVPGMPPHQVRMRFERDELSIRLSKLNGFIGTAPFIALDETEQELMHEQAEVMQRYLACLQDRIALFNEQQDAA